MLFLLGGLAILGGVLLLGYLFVNANPMRLAGAVRWTAIVVGVVVAVAFAVALLVLSEGRIMALLLPVLPLIPALRRWLGRRSGAAGPAPGRSSEVDTPFLRMRLDHDTGNMEGTVLRGQFAGLTLAELGRAELLAVLRECRTGDEEGARLLEAYLDRTDPDWREDWHAGAGSAGAESAGADSPGADSTRSGRSSEMTVADAYAVLGLPPGADEAAIRAAHHRLMKQLHPDHGGTDYLATQINRARDILLRRGPA
jgi:hypothetical protein